jgi:hypothetical protein
MKKNITVFTLLLIATSTFAQVKIGVKGGWNYASAKAVYSDVKQSTSFINSMGIGITAKVPFDGVLNFSPSVMVNKRGFIVKPTSGVNSKEQYSITYVDLIPAFSVFFPKKNNSFAISLGPDFGFTNFGKLKYTDSTGTTSKKIKFGYGSIGWFDIGLNASISYHTKKIFIEAGYLYGLSSINNNEEYDQRNIRNRVFSLSIGYFFKQTAAQ